MKNTWKAQFLTQFLFMYNWAAFQYTIFNMTA